MRSDCAHPVHTAHTMHNRPCAHCIDLSFCGRVADMAGARAEGVPGGKYVLLAIPHLYIQERAAEAARVARYGPAKLSGLVAAAGP